LLVLDILKTEKSRVRDRFMSHSKYSRRGTFFIQKKVGSALTEAENWDLLVDCASPFICLSTLLSLASERHFWL
jgi:hypothetical protein